MNMFKNICILAFASFLLISCRKSKSDNISRAIEEWMGKEIIYPSIMTFQTFLLNKDNKIVAIGNPIYNPKIKDLYLKIIQGEGIGQEGEDKEIQPEVTIDKTSVSFGKFDWQEEQKTTFTLKNAGDNPLVIQDVTTSCGCTTVAYSKEPVRPGKETVIEIGYKAEDPGYFNKTITVYCNAKISPLTLKISGSANEIKKEI